MIVLGLGTNQGDRLSFLREAIHLLKSPLTSPLLKVLAVSPLYASDALLPEGAPNDWDCPYLNLAVLCKTELPPLELLKHVKKIEAQVGRKKRGRWAPREIDIDILMAESFTFESEDLVIPHRHLTQRPFALLPLCDLVPHWRHPHHPPLAELTRPWRFSANEDIPFKTHRSTLCLTECVGILNITPDSFSDGGLYLSPDQAVSKALEMLNDGVRILDVGAESTRPDATPLSPKEEWNRLRPILDALKTLENRSTPLILSVDTRNAEVAQKALKNGAHWINDVSGLSTPAMRKVIAESEAKVVIMHSLTVPPKRDVMLESDVDPIDPLLIWAKQKIQQLQEYGISPGRVIFDPGIGFGKSIEQTWSLFRTMNLLQEIGVPILVGHSRKSFLSSLASVSPTDRDLETSILSVELARKGVDYLRVHEPKLNSRSLSVWSQIDGISRA